MKEKGFTLIELMVVVIIIAILVAIGVVIYGNATRQARDDRRIADINTIANSMEAHLNTTTASGCASGTVGQYCPLDTTFFSSQQIPQDPLNSSTSTPCNKHKCWYCFKASGSAAALCATGDSAVASGVPPAASTYMVCTNLETYNGPGNKDFYCRSNQQ